MSKHTPGPWNVGASGHNPAQITSESTPIAQVYGIPLHIRIEEAPEGWGLSNARLIASAPDLLKERDEALSRIEAALEIFEYYNAFDRAIAMAEALRGER